MFFMILVGLQLIFCWCFGILWYHFCLISESGNVVPRYVARGPSRTKHTHKMTERAQDVSFNLWSMRVQVLESWIYPGLSRGYRGVPEEHGLREKQDIWEIRRYPDIPGRSISMLSGKKGTFENFGAHIRHLLRHSQHYNCDIHSMITSKFVVNCQICSIITATFVALQLRRA